MSMALAAPPRSDGWHMARRLAGPTVSVVSLAAVAWWAVHQRAPRIPTTVSALLLLALALGVYVCVTVARGLRWHEILRGAGVPARMADVQALVVVGYMGNTVLPARGGELLRVLLLGARTRSSRVTILGTLVAERLLDVVALLTMLLVLAFVTASEVRGAAELSLAAAGVLLALIALALLGWRLGARRRRGEVARHLDSLTVATRNLASSRGGALVLLTAAVWMGEGCIYWLVGRMLSLHIDLAQGCFLVALSSLAAAIPAAPGYAGTYDAAIQLGLRALHVQGGPAVAFGLLVRLIIFLPITAAGLILMVVRYGGLASLRRMQWRRSAAAAEEAASYVGLVE